MAFVKVGHGFKSLRSGELGFVLCVNDLMLTAL